MPPQPLSHFKPGIGYALTGDGFEKRPKVAQGIAACIAQWTLVETQLGRLFISLTKADPVKGAEAYAAYSNAMAKRVAIEAVSTASLSQDKYNLIKALLQIVKTNKSTRDRIAHWYWGVPEIEDAMIIVDPKTLWKQSANIDKAYYAKDRETLFKHVRLPADKVYVYKSSDLERDANEFGEIAKLMSRTLSFVLLDSANPSYGAQYIELTQDVRMAEALLRLQNTGQ